MAMYNDMTGLEHVAYERERQLRKNWDDHSPNHSDGQLVECASYILGDYMEDTAEGTDSNDWPVERAMRVKQKYRMDYVARLRVAAALIAAEIDRIQADPMNPVNN